MAVHGTILFVDVERFGNPQRIDIHRASVRSGLYGALATAFQQAGIDRAGWREQDTGDGVLMLGPPDLVKGRSWWRCRGPWPRRCVRTTTPTRRENGSGCGWRCTPVR